MSTLLQQRVAIAETSLCISAVSPEPVAAGKHKVGSEQGSEQN